MCLEKKQAGQEAFDELVKREKKGKEEEEIQLSRFPFVVVTPLYFYFFKLFGGRTSWIGLLQPRTGTCRVKEKRVQSIVPLSRLAIDPVIGFGGKCELRLEVDLVLVGICLRRRIASRKLFFLYTTD